VKIVGIHVKWFWFLYDLKQFEVFLGISVKKIAEIGFGQTDGRTDMSNLVVAVLRAL
jgi:hypothetical protein